MQVAARALAKLTLSLAVRGGRPDGFHEIEALTVSVGPPADQLEVWDRPEAGVDLELVAGLDSPPVPAGPDNLVTTALAELLALAALEGHAGFGFGARLCKVVPVAAGLGGGSADAAAALVGGSRLLAARGGPGVAPVPRVALRALAATIGSDVPFCLDGGLAWMRGRGERIDPLPAPTGAGPVLLVTPPFGLATAAVYRAWDELGGPAGRAVPAPRWVAAHAPVLANDLEPAAEHLAPDLRAFREELERATGAPAILAGSGPTLAVLLEPSRSDDADRLARQARAALGARAFVGSVGESGVVLTV